MCIGVPGKIVSKNGIEGIVETKGIERNVNLILVPEAKLGDHVLIHAGAAIQLIDAKEAQLTLELLEELFIDEDGRE